MFNLEKAIREWRKELRKNEALEDGFITELEGHLRDAIERQLEQGKNEEEAFYYSIKSFGDYNLIGGEYHKTKSRRINKKPPWQVSKWMPTMLAHYIKVYKRNLLRNKVSSFINITGLALGLASCILITIWILDEFSYDRFHINAERIFGVVDDINIDGQKISIVNTPAPLAAALIEELPEVSAASRYQKPFEENMLKYGDKCFYEKKLVYVDASFLEFLTFPLIRGYNKSALSDPNSIVISESTAKKYFGDENPIGKILLLDNKHDLMITGVFANVPHNSTLQFDILVPYEKFEFTRGLNWFSNSPQTLLQLKENVSAADVEKKIRKLIQSKQKGGIGDTYSLLPIKDFHFSVYFEGKGRMTSIYIFSVIAFFILFIACTNFMNLSIISSAERSKEIGLRKVVGSTRKSIAFQFLGEYTLLVVCSLLIALIIAALCLPLFNTLFDKNLRFINFLGWNTLFAMLGIVMFTGIVGGIYPAVILSSLKPAVIFKQINVFKIKKISFRKLLVVFQFFLSIILILIMSVIYSQLDYIKTKDLGMDKEQIMVIELRGGAAGKYEVFKNNLTGSPSITDISGSSHLPIRMRSGGEVSWQGKLTDDKTRINIASVDYDYCKTMKIDMLEGSDFSEKTLTENADAVLINEEMLKIMGHKTAINEILTFGNPRPFRIIGVMKNYHYLPLSMKIGPLILCNFKGNAFKAYTPGYVLIKIKQKDISGTIDLIKEKWQKVYEYMPFQYSFLDEEFGAAYKDDTRLGNIISVFAVIAIFISGLGLFGLASFTVLQRKKEIAIRKVLGSSIIGITKLLFKEYFNMALIANVIAWPIGYYIATKWLEDYAYKTTVGIKVFAIAVIFTFIIIIISVGYQSLKAAYTNPVKNIKYE